jgi:hypothetical protein
MCLAVDDIQLQPRALLAVWTPTDNKVTTFTKALTHELATKDLGKQAHKPYCGG